MRHSNMLRAAAGIGITGGPVVEFLQVAASNTDASSYTFSAQNLGEAAADRLMVAAIATRAAAARTIDAVTIGGVSATIIQVGRSSGTVFNRVALAYASVPTGTTGDLVVTFNTSTLRCRTGLWRVVGLDSHTPVDTDSSAATPPTATLTTSDAGIAFGAAAVAVTANTGSVTTWTNLTDKSFDSGSESAINISGAYGATTAGTLAITATLSGGILHATDPNPCAVFATFA